MPIIDHLQAPEVSWRPSYGQWDTLGRRRGVTGTFSDNTAELPVFCPAFYPYSAEPTHDLEGARLAPVKY